MTTVSIVLNGTYDNSYKRLYGIRQNPFPIFGETFMDANAGKLIKDLAANPIKDIDDLKNRLNGCSQEFIDLCCQKFVPGERVIFTITWED